jgi:two-component system, OmpR family, sensor histidine kinase KdpD
MQYSVALIIALSRLALEPSNIALIELLAVLFTASTAGHGPGIVASVLSFLASSCFFVEPLYILTVEDPQDIVR